MDNGAFGTMGGAGNMGMGMASANTVAGAWQSTQPPVGLQQSSGVMTMDVMDMNTSSQYDFGGGQGMDERMFHLNQRDATALHTWRTNGIFLDMV